MLTANCHPVGAYLADRMALIQRASPGPLIRAKGRRGAYPVHTGAAGRPVATFARDADAALFAEAVADLRALVGVVAELFAGHHDNGTGRCAGCGQHSPCRDRRVIESELVPRAIADSPAWPTHPTS